MKQQKQIASSMRNQAAPSLKLALYQLDFTATLSWVGVMVIVYS